MMMMYKHYCASGVVAAGAELSEHKAVKQAATNKLTVSGSLTQSWFPFHYTD